MNLFTGRMVPSTQISIRSYCFADDDSSIHYCRSNGDAIKEYRICLCEPCTFSIDVLVPYECFLFHQTLPNRLDIFDNRGIETQIWTNLCDKYSSTGRWHAIQAQRTEIHKELRGRIHSFSVSVIPIRCGVFEFTARTRAPKSGNSNWIWADRYEKNESLHVIRTASQRPALTQGTVRQLAQWFDDILTNWYLSNSNHQLIERPYQNALTAYTACFLSVIALQCGVDFETCITMTHILSENEWLSRKSNSMKVLIWCIGSSYLASTLANSIDAYVLGPVTLESTRRVRNSYVDYKKRYTEVPSSILTLMNFPVVNSVKRKLMNTINPINEHSHLSSLLEDHHHNDILMELVLAYVKSHNLSAFSHTFYRKLMMILVSSQSPIIRLLVQRILRCLFDKECLSRESHPDEQSHHDCQMVTLAIVDSFELYNENMITERKIRMQYEEDMTVEGVSEGGPLSPLLSLIRMIYIIRPQGSSGDTLPDLLIISSSLLKVYSHLSDEHPDFLRMKETIISLGRQYPNVSLHIAKRLIVMKTEFTNNHTYYLCILSQLLNAHPFVFSSHLSLLNRIISYMLWCMHSDNVYVTLKALQMMEFHSKSVIWELILQCDPKIIEQLSEYLEEAENHWLSNIRVAAQQLHSSLESAEIIKNGVFNTDAYSSVTYTDYCVHQSSKLRVSQCIDWCVC